MPGTAVSKHHHNIRRAVLTRFFVQDLSLTVAMILVCSDLLITVLHQEFAVFYFVFLPSLVPSVLLSAPVQEIIEHLARL